MPAVILLDHPYAAELRGRMPFVAVTSLVCLCIGLGCALGAGAAREDRDSRAR